MRCGKPFMFAGLALASSLALGQSGTTLGALLDQGAKKLSTDEVKTVLAGATSTYQTPTGGRMIFNFRADGLLNGNFTNATGEGRTSGSGSWKTEDGGKYCVSMNWSAPWMPSGTVCNFIFKVGEKTFVATSDSDRGVAANERWFTK